MRSGILWRRAACRLVQCGCGQEVGLYFEVSIKYITFAAVSVSRRPVLPVGESKGKRVKGPYSSRCCMLLRLGRNRGAALFNHRSRGIGKAPTPERVRRPAET